MTTGLAQQDEWATRNRKRAPISRDILFARATILLERLAPIAVLAGAPVALLVVAGLYDLFAAVPRWAHWIALVAAVAGSISIAARMRRRDLWPRRREALARLERDGGVRHDALHALEDSPATDGGPLWDAHVAAMREKALSARLAPPRMTANEVDPYGARYAALALAVVGWIAAGGEAGERMIAAFAPSDPSAGAAGFADLWIEPPDYVDKAPIYLLRATDSLPGRREAIKIPEGAVAHAQVNASARFRLSLKAATRTIEGEQNSGRSSLVLRTSGVLSLRAGGRAGRWPIEIVDDRAPKVEFVETPAADRDGRLAFIAQIDDDYGAVSASLRLKLDPDQERPLDAPKFSADTKRQRRIIKIDGFAGAGARSVAVDLAADPWAGLKVIATLIVTDAAGQSGETTPSSITLPAKPFFNPLARAVIEQRQSLAVAPNEWRRAEWAFNGLTLGPEHFFDEPTDYLLLRTAMWRINRQGGGDYKETVAEFWPLALQLEDEKLELARRRLDAAKEALRSALENGATDAEIERLTEEMRAALQQYLQALAEAGAQGGEDGPPADQVVDAADLEAMLDSIRDLAKSGAEGAARQALADLENLLNALRLSGAGGGASGEGQSGAAGAAGDLIARQRALADKSFERGQTRGAEGDDLAAEQGGIAGDLSEIMKTLEGAPGANPDPKGAAARALARAHSEMRRSEESLEGEDFEAANDAMERAIASLREGAETLARARQAEARARGGGAGSPMRDPLGRPVGPAYGQDVEVPEKSAAQRSRELLQELRRRLSDGRRTEEEIEYLERLLERF